MDKKILIVEDESLVAFDLKLILTRAGYKVCGIADSVKEALEIIEKQMPEMVLLDIFLKGNLTGIDLAKILTKQNIAFVYLSANFQESILETAKSTQPYGFLVKPFREKELLITLDVAFYRHRNSIESKLRQEHLLEETFVQIVSEATGWEQKLLAIAKKLQPHIPFDYLTIITKNDGEFLLDGITFLRIGFDEYQIIGIKEFINITRTNAEELKKLQSVSPVSSIAEFFNEADFEKMVQKYPIKKVIAKSFNIHSYLGLPLFIRNEIITLSFYNRKEDGYSSEHFNMLSRMQRSLTVAVEQIMAGVDMNNTVRLAEGGRKSPSGQSKIVKTGFEGIIGKSHQMLTVLDHLSIVAPLDTSVLILGESGTGKEAIAKNVHKLSPRANNQLVTVNCASLPATLIESELFGHEKGAFTGATEKRIGKFELADKGTIFLDEIGEMPAELQVKLLRVLQEQEIERIGGRAPIKIDVRIIAATNRNLEKEVEDGRFRLDLYYRLYVFPILLPPLRERKDDIEALACHFIEKYALKSGKNVTHLSPEVFTRLMSYHWPGNVRELEHLIERSVLFARDCEIKDVFLPSFHQKTNQIAVTPETCAMKTIDENARDHILTVLRKCNGRISGPGGAAEILEVPPSTLHSKIKKLGIKKWSD